MSTKDRLKWTPFGYGSHHFPEIRKFEWELPQDTIHRDRDSGVAEGYGNIKPVDIREEILNKLNLHS
ncbi:hypothetical protein INT48_009200 [Thamnidium elegans]|uniref:Uncharacterized protein n=1 Tax=Thamnidium elegans TaxID=101142 RepID=A0A8H7SP51_9FUNG|nr:hypothetical protein INT48_009200 [Thamnidium elegans]